MAHGDAKDREDSDNHEHGAEKGGDGTHPAVSPRACYTTDCLTCGAVRHVISGGMPTGRASGGISASLKGPGIDTSLLIAHGSGQNRAHCGTDDSTADRAECANPDGDVNSSPRCVTGIPDTANRNGLTRDDPRGGAERRADRRADPHVMTARRGSNRRRRADRSTTEGREVSGVACDVNRRRHFDTRRLLRRDPRRRAESDRQYDDAETMHVVS